MGNSIFFEDSNFTSLSEQDERVLEYIASICRSDEYDLNKKGFFDKVCLSIRKNGVEKTAEIYELDVDIVKIIKIK